MLKMLHSKKGFTLIELLIVVAIIAILAAIAIPQFSQYRIRGYNSAAVADLRNARTSEEAFFSDWQSYASTGAAGAPAVTAIFTNATVPIVIAAGAISAGPPAIPSAATTIQFGMSQNVGLFAQTIGTGGQLTLGTKNTAGDRCYGQDSSGPVIYWAGSTTSVAIAAAGLPAPVANQNAFAPGAPPAPAATVAPCAITAAWAPL
jgi:type IV pilus assembly protein PilA